MVWLPWMIILTLIGLKHPPTLYDELPINQTRVMLGISCIIIFFLCFAPLPIYLQ